MHLTGRHTNCLCMNKHLIVKNYDIPFAIATLLFGTGAREEAYKGGIRIKKMG